MEEGTVRQRHTPACPAPVERRRPPHRCRGPWEYVVDLGADSTGRRRQETKSGYPTKTAATAALRELVKTLATDVTITDTTVGEYLDTWLLGKHTLRPTTSGMYTNLADLYLRPHIGDVPLLELRAHHLDRLYAAITIGVRGRPLSPSTIRRVHAVLRSALNSAVKRRLLPYNPADHVELAPENPKRPKPWTAEQCLHFLDAITDDRLYALYRLYLFTGMRRGEAIGLRWDRVDLDDGLLVIVEQITSVGSRRSSGRARPGAETGSWPSIPRRRRPCATTARPRSSSAAWAQGFDPAGLVFTREDGSPLRPEYVTRHFQDLAARAGLPPVRLHDLRHTSASLALKAGVAMKVVSDRLGHSTIAVTANLYTHVYDEVARDGADRLASVLTSRSDARVSELLAREADEEPS